MKYSLKRLYRKIFPGYIIELEKAISDCKTLLDLGCGSSSPIKSFSKKFYSIGIDAFKQNIYKSERENIHDKYYTMNVLDIYKKFKNNSFDCVIALDLIEHLTKEEGFKLINIMERIAKKKIIIFTSNGFLPQKEYENNPLQEHKCGWTVEEMKNMGYEVIGINGWKILRGEYAYIKFKPKFFWSVVSDITQTIIRNNPKNAFQLLCIKYK